MASLSIIEPGRYDLEGLLSNLNGTELPAGSFNNDGSGRSSLRSLHQTQSIRNFVEPVDGSDEKFIQGIINEQSAENFRPFVEIITNSFDSINERSPDEYPNLNVNLKVIPDGGYAVRISDKGQGTGMSQETFIQKYLPPTATTKADSYESIGQMGVGAQQVAGLIRRVGDEAIIMSTDESGMSILYKLTYNDQTQRIEAVLAGGSVRPTSLADGPDKQGVSTTIKLTRETSAEIGFSSENFAAYLSDRFGNYSRGGLSLSVKGKADALAAEHKLDPYMLTDDYNYARALEINLSRLTVEKHQAEARRSASLITEKKYQITPSNNEDRKSSSREVTSSLKGSEADKKIKMAVSNQKSDESLVYVNVLGMRFGEPIVVRGRQLPATVDVDFDYKIGQITESRTDLRLTETDIKRVVNMFKTFDQSADVTNIETLNILVALAPLAQKLHEKSLNKLDNELDIPSAVKSKAARVMQTLGAGSWAPENLLSYVDEPHNLQSVVSDEFFDCYYKTINFPNLKAINNVRWNGTGSVYMTDFKSDKAGTIYAEVGERFLLLNSKYFKGFESDKKILHDAESVKLVGVVANQNHIKGIEERRLVSLVADPKSENNKKSVKLKNIEYAGPHVDVRDIFCDGFYQNEGNPMYKKAIDEVENRVKYLITARNNWGTYSPIEKLEVLKKMYMSGGSRTYEYTGSLPITERLHLDINDSVNMDAFFSLSFDEYIDKASKLDFDKLMRERMYNFSPKDFFDKKEYLMRVVLNADKYYAIGDLSWKETYDLYKKIGWAPYQYDKVFYDNVMDLTDKEIELIKTKIENIPDSRDRYIYTDDKDVYLMQKEKLYMKEEIFRRYAGNDPRFINMSDTQSQRLHELFEFELKADFHNLITLFEGGTRAYDYLDYVLNEGIKYDLRFIELVYDESTNLDVVRNAVSLASKLGLSYEEVSEHRNQLTYISDSNSYQMKAFKMLFSGDNKLNVRTENLFSEIPDADFTPVDINSLSGAGHDESLIFKRRILQTINSIEPGLGGSANEIIKNSVQAVESSGTADRSIRVTDYIENNYEDLGFGFSIEDQAGWEDVHDALTRLTVPGSGDGLHGVHFLTLLKDYDVIRVRAVDRNGRAAYIEYRSVIHPDLNKIDDVLIKYYISENSGFNPGTIVEGFKKSEIPQVESALFRSNIMKFAKNVPTESAQIMLVTGQNDSGNQEILNQVSEVVIPPQSSNIGNLQINLSSAEWYKPELTVDNTPINFDLAEFIKNADYIPEPYKMLLQDSGFTVSLTDPNTPIIRSTYQFKNEIQVNETLNQYLQSNWKNIVEALAVKGLLNFVEGKFLMDDVWYDEPVAAATRSLIGGQSEQADWSSLTDLADIGKYFYYMPMIPISDDNNNITYYSISQIVLSQINKDGKIPPEKIPPMILREITKNRSNAESSKKAHEGYKVMPMPKQYKRIVKHGTSIAKEHLGSSVSNVKVAAHVGINLNAGFENAYYLTANNTVSYNLKNMAETLSNASLGDVYALGGFYNTTMHEFQHALLRQDESPFSHTLDFYNRVSRSIAEVPAEKIVPLLGKR